MKTNQWAIQKKAASEPCSQVTRILITLTIRQRLEFMGNLARKSLLSKDILL